MFNRTVLKEVIWSAPQPVEASIQEPFDAPTAAISTERMDVVPSACESIENIRELLTTLEKKPPSRYFLISVLQAQIWLGLNDNLGAMFAADDWDDANEEE